MLDPNAELGNTQNIARIVRKQQRHVRTLPIRLTRRQFPQRSVINCLNCSIYWGSFKQRKNTVATTQNYPYFGERSFNVGYLLCKSTII